MDSTAQLNDSQLALVRGLGQRLQRARQTEVQLKSLLMSTQREAKALADGIEGIVATATGDFSGRRKIDLETGVVTLLPVARANGAHADV